MNLLGRRPASRPLKMLLRSVISRCMYSTDKSVLAPTMFHRIMDNFPDGIQLAFAYGSGVSKQEGHKDMSENMIDLIFAVDDPRKWHKENLKENSSHYSFLKYLGSKRIAKVQENIGAGVYFNTLVPLENRIIKYGVISTENLITDLLDWDTLYVSGRLHKPCRLLVFPTNNELVSAMKINLSNAIHSSLLLMPETFTEKELYTAITGLSYNGDFRMIFGEDKNKVSNIVGPNIENFRCLYGTLLGNEEHVMWNKEEGYFEQYPNQVTQYHHLSLLPKSVQMSFLTGITPRGHFPDLEEILKHVANDRNCNELVAKALQNIVWRSSSSQSFKSIWTAGFLKSIKYSMKKVKKMLKK